jgi:hypothetical protein
MNATHRVFPEPHSDQELTLTIYHFKNKISLREWLEHMGRKLRKYWYI